MIRIGWEQTNLSMPAVESYQTANMDIDNVTDSEKSASSSALDDQLLFKKVVVASLFSQAKWNWIDIKYFLALVGILPETSTDVLFIALSTGRKAK